MSSIGYTSVLLVDVHLSATSSVRTMCKLWLHVTTGMKVGPPRVMPSSHRRYGQDKTVMSCRCWRCELNWRQVKTVGDRTFQNWTCLIFLHFCPVYKCGLDKTVQSQIYWELLKTVLTCHQFSSHHQHEQDKTVLSSPCRRRAKTHWHLYTLSRTNCRTGLLR